MRSAKELRDGGNIETKSTDVDGEFRRFILCGLALGSVFSSGAGCSTDAAGDCFDHASSGAGKSVGGGRGIGRPRGACEILFDDTCGTDKDTFRNDHRSWGGAYILVGLHGARSEERRVGKECRSRWSP